VRHIVMLLGLVRVFDRLLTTNTVLTMQHGTEVCCKVLYRCITVCSRAKPRTLYVLNWSLEAGPLFLTMRMAKSSL